jgi:hypothetical protein
MILIRSGSLDTCAPSVRRKYYTKTVIWREIIIFRWEQWVRVETLSYAYTFFWESAPLSPQVSQLQLRGGLLYCWLISWPLKPEARHQSFTKVTLACSEYHLMTLYCPASIVCLLACLKWFLLYPNGKSRKLLCHNGIPPQKSQGRLTFRVKELKVVVSCFCCCFAISMAATWGHRTHNS